MQIKVVAVRCCNKVFNKPKQCLQKRCYLQCSRFESDKLTPSVPFYHMKAINRLYFNNFYCYKVTRKKIFSTATCVIANTVNGIVSARSTTLKINKSIVKVII